MNGWLIHCIYFHFLPLHFWLRAYLLPPPPSLCSLSLSVCAPLNSYLPEERWGISPSSSVSFCLPSTKATARLHALLDCFNPDSFETFYPFLRPSDEGKRRKRRRRRRKSRRE
mmetsp:Transcript_14088/g.28240  ORF Transcript_14088/g.28240 Transcript_14088/m.28240 type:complete len:113 (+) Transcript_14088:2160-2498(+)